MKKVASFLLIGLFALIPSVGSAQTNLNMNGDYTFEYDVSVTSLTPGNCMQAGAGGLLTTTAAPCAAASTMMTEVAQVTASSSAPWEATFTFGTPFTATPICVASSFNATPNSTVANIVSESTTSAVIFDSSQSGATFNVQCTGP